MATARRLVDLTGPDFYPTPRWATKALLHYERFRGSITEPFAGDHAMVRVIRKAGYTVHSSDLHDYDVGDKLCSYRRLKGSFDNVVSNPPFKLATKAIEYFLPRTRGKVCMLLRLSFLESQDRYERFYQQRRLSRIRIFSERLSLYPRGDKGKKAGGTVAYAWFIFDCASEPCTPELRFIKPGLFKK